MDEINAEKAWIHTDMDLRRKNAWVPHPTTCFRYSYAQFIDKANKNHTYSDFKHIDIDNLLVPIIKLCWANNIRTNGCCQGTDSENAYINFRDYEAAVFTRP